MVEPVAVLRLLQLIEPAVALAVRQHPRYAHARLQALLEAAELAAAARLRVDLALLALHRKRREGRKEERGQDWCIGIAA